MNTTERKPLNITITRSITPAWHLAACWTAAVTISRELPGASGLQAMITFSRWNLPTEEQAAVELEKLTQMAEGHAAEAPYTITGYLGIPPVADQHQFTPVSQQRIKGMHRGQELQAVAAGPAWPRADAPARSHLWARAHGPEHTGVECFYCRQRASRPQPGACPGRGGEV